MTTPTEDEALEDIEAEKFEIDLTKPTSPGNFGVDPDPVNHLFDLTEFDELLTCYLSFDEPITSLFSKNTDFNFFSSAAEAPSAIHSSPLPAVPPPTLQVTPASQPGSQEEQIEAL